MTAGGKRASARRPGKERKEPWIWTRTPAAAKADQGYTGKWMLFPALDRIEQAWETVRQATEAGTLGISAKSATDRTSDRGRLICVYTADHRDLDDVRRVLFRLRELGFSQPLYYKEHEATRALIYEQGIASLYESPHDDVIRQRRKPLLPEPDANPYEDALELSRRRRLEGQLLP